MCVFTDFLIKQDINRLKFPSCSFSAYEKFKIPVDYMKGYDIYYANLKSSEKVEKQVNLFF